MDRWLVDNKELLVDFGVNITGTFGADLSGYTADLTQWMQWAGKDDPQAQRDAANSDMMFAGLPSVGEDNSDDDSGSDGEKSDDDTEDETEMAQNKNSADICI